MLQERARVRRGLLRHATHGERKERKALGARASTQIIGHRFFQYAGRYLRKKTVQYHCGTVGLVNGYGTLVYNMVQRMQPLQLRARLM